jgi:hypothetical protein
MNEGNGNGEEKTSRGGFRLITNKHRADPKQEPTARHCSAVQLSAIQWTGGNDAGGASLRLVQVYKAESLSA